MTKDGEELMWAMKAAPQIDVSDGGCRVYHVISQIGEIELEHDICAHSEAEAQWHAMYVMANYLYARQQRRKRRNNGRKKNVRQDDSIIR